MFGLGTKGKILFQQQWQGNLSEYVTVVAWSDHGLLAASSAAGEVVIWQDGSLVSILPAGLVMINRILLICSQLVLSQLGLAVRMES